MKFKNLFSVLCLLLLVQHGVYSQDFNYTLSDDSLVNHYASIRRVYYATRVEHAPRIDGKLSDWCWKNVGKWDSDFIQQVPNQAKAPSFQTKVKVLYDNKNLYVGIIALDKDPDKIATLLGPRDVRTNGDVAGIAIDSYNDKKTAFEFDLTAAGQKIDGEHRGNGNFSNNWDAVWEGKTSIGDSAWFAEMKIPFSQLRYANKDQQVWGVHFWRYIYRLGEESHWKLIPVDAPAMVYIFGELRGIENIPYHRNVEFLPYTTAKHFTESTNDKNYSFGLDGKIGISSDFTLDYTFNPDFGQVEADPSVLNLTSYEVFYNEKRPFFLEGNNILSFSSASDELYYSRRIGHAPSFEPDYDEDAGERLETPQNVQIINALKLTGKNDRGFSLGVLNSMTARETATVFKPEEETTEAVEPFTNFSVLRAKQDFNRGNSSIGGILTSTIRNIKDENLEFLPEKAFVGGLDWDHHWKRRKYFFEGSVFGSHISGSETAIESLQRNSRHYFQRPDISHVTYDPTRTSLDGWGGNLAGGKQSGKLWLWGELHWRSPGIDFNDMGYLKLADYIYQKAYLIYRVNKPKGILLSHLTKLTQGHEWNFAGRSERDVLIWYTRLRFKNYHKFDFVTGRYFNELDTRELRGGPALRKDPKNMLLLAEQTNPYRPLYLALRSDFYWGSDDISKKNEYTAVLTWRAGRRLQTSLETKWAFEKDNAQYVKRKVIDDEIRYVVGLLDRKTLSATIRAEYFLTPELSFQYYANPYVTTGKYLNYRRVADPLAHDLNQRYEMLVNNNGLLQDAAGNLYHNFSWYDYNFSFNELRSNFVARWEYKAGSTVYFVWTHTRSGYKDEYSSSFGDSLRDLRKMGGQNAFMIKINYWFSL